jgi:hypothetical protein
VRYRLMATYRGAPYEAGIGPSDRDVVLFAACPPPEELRFEPATGHWRKRLRIEEVHALWESRPVGVFRGERCMVLDDLGERLHIAYLGHDGYLAERLGYWQVDRGVFELITPRDEVTDIVEERLEYDYPHRAQLDPGPGDVAAPATRNGPAGDPGFGRQPPWLGYLGAPAGPGASLPAENAPVPAANAPLPAENGPLPVEAAARRAASAAAAARRAASTAAAAHRTPAGRRAARRRQSAGEVFAELARMAAIPATAYSLGAAVDGAICLVPAHGGFEVFSASAGVRHEVRLFADEESAYFYLFGLLAAEAVRTGELAPRG